MEIGIRIRKSIKDIVITHPVTQPYVCQCFLCISFAHRGNVAEYVRQVVRKASDDDVDPSTREAQTFTTIWKNMAVVFECMARTNSIANYTEVSLPLAIRFLSRG